LWVTSDVSARPFVDSIVNSAFTYVNGGFMGFVAEPGAYGATPSELNHL